MASEHEIRDLARRVAQRVLAERGRAEHPAGRAELPGLERPAGVHVVLEPRSGSDRPCSDAEAVSSAARERRELITAECLRDLAPGSTLHVGVDALVTEPAREEAWRRRIAIVHGAGGVAGLGAGGRLRVAVGSDHGGFVLKLALLEWIRELGHVAQDLGTKDENPVDYPDFARAVAESVASGGADLGVCVDGAGIGSAMAANKVPGVLAAMCYDVPTARNAREHNHANVLTLGGRMLSEGQAHEILRAFLATPVGGERHRKRVEKIRAIEVRYSRPAAANMEEKPR